MYYLLKFIEIKHFKFFSFTELHITEVELAGGSGDLSKDCRE